MMQRPSRPFTAYNLFFQEQRQRMLAAVSDNNGGAVTPSKRAPEFDDMARMVSKRWKVVSDADKAYYVSLAELSNQRYFQGVDTSCKPDNEDVPAFLEPTHPMQPFDGDQSQQFKALRNGNGINTSVGGFDLNGVSGASIINTDANFPRSVVQDTTSSLPQQQADGFGQLFDFSNASSKSEIDVWADQPIVQMGTAPSLAQSSESSNSNNMDETLMSLFAAEFLPSTDDSIETQENKAVNIISQSEDSMPQAWSYQSPFYQEQNHNTEQSVSSYTRQQQAFGMDYAPRNEAQNYNIPDPPTIGAGSCFDPQQFMSSAQTSSFSGSLQQQQPSTVSPQNYDDLRFRLLASRLGPEAVEYVIDIFGRSTNSFND